MSLPTTPMTSREKPAAPPIQPEGERIKTQLVVFDLSGTTVRDDNAVNICLRESLAAHATFSPGEINRVMGQPKPVAIRGLLESRQANGHQVSNELVARVYDDFQERMMRFYRTDACVGPMPHALETFTRLKQSGLSLALETGFNRSILDAVLRRLGWEDGELFDATVASDEVARGRPHADLVLKTMELTGTRDSHAVAKVGDTASDLQEGMAARCGLVIGVTNGYCTREELRAQPHTHLIDDLRELPAIVLADCAARGKGECSIA